MFDFTITQVTHSGNVFCSALFFLILCLYWRKCATINALYSKDLKGEKLLFFIILIFAVTAWYAGDFFGYKKNVEEYTPGMQHFHLEKVYEFIILFTQKNYLLFRIIVWGGALTLFYSTSKACKVNPLLSLFYMFLLYATIFSYARASLAMAIYYFGVVVFSNGQKKRLFLLIVIGLLLIICSYFFHKSMLLMILIFVFYFVPITRKTIIPSIIFVTLIGYEVDLLMNSFQGLLMSLDDIDLSERIEYNIEMADSREQINATLYGWIAIILQYFPFYVPFVMISFIMLQKRSGNIPMTMKGLYRITFATVVASTTMLLFSSQSLTYFYRYLYMSFIPLTLLTIYLLRNRYIKLRWYQWSLYLAGGYNILTFLSYFFS